ncbi:uncharacterized protein isoform X2 [Musca autumnalis]|uniref:uncharacterized protein isoform X2 n=1 Tax=Musca autumnalis TaxID=221902 RepID=UPI003CF5FF25
MVAVNWLRWSSFVLPFIALFHSVRCITVDAKNTNENETHAPAIQTEQYKSNNIEDNVTLSTGDSELSASERTRRLIPYMSFYVPVQDLPINQQYAAIPMTKNGPRLSATGTSSGSHIPLPPQYVNIKTFSSPGGASYLQSPTAATHYQTSAGDAYHAPSYGGGGSGGGTQVQEQQYQVIPTTIKYVDNGSNHKYPGHRLLSGGPPGPSAPSSGINLAGNKINPIRHKTVQYFPPLPSHSTTSSSTFEASSVKHQRQQQQQQQHNVAYRPRTKQSKINLTPFTPANSVPGNFVPIVYTPVNSNNNNIVITSHGTSSSDTDNSPPATPLNGGGKHQQQTPIEYSDPLHASIDVETPHHRPSPSTHQHQQPPNVHQQHRLNPKQPSPYFSVTPLSSGSETSNSQYQNTQAIGPSTAQYADYPVDEPKQSLDEDHDKEAYRQQVQLPIKPTLGPPTHAFIIVTTAAPPTYNQPVIQENYGSTMRPLYNNKANIKLQPVLKEKNVNYPTIRQPNPTIRPSITLAPTTPNTMTADIAPKYVYVKEEFGQKLSTPPIKLKPVPKYENDNHIPTKQQTHELQHLLPKPPVDGQGHNELGTADAAVRPQQHTLSDPNELPDIRTSSLAEILHKLQETNHLPHTLTPDNIDNSIKTLIRILNNLKKTQTIVANPPQHHEQSPSISPDYDYATGSDEQDGQELPHQDDDVRLSPIPANTPNKHPGPSTGRPGIDYPNYAAIPQTSFDCSQQRYKGFFGDPETNCQVWHYCDLNGGKASFLCPNGTIFSQIALTCDWWFNVKCASTAQLYVLNERLYKYILPFTPKFPEDYSGPLVDKYLALKFQEMEEKMRIEKEKALEEAATEHANQEDSTSEDSKEDNKIEETTTEEDVPNTPKISVLHKHESVNSQVSEQSSERNFLIDDEVDDISQRGSIDTFESTTVSSISSKDFPLSLRPIVVSSTVEPDYDEDAEAHDHENKDIGSNLRTDKPVSSNQTVQEIIVNIPNKSESSTPNSKAEHMKITVEKVDVIEIKPDGATGHLIREMILNSETK